jgi:hypothetical protein
MQKNFKTNSSSSLCLSLSLSLPASVLYILCIMCMYETCKGAILLKGLEKEMKKERERERERETS